MAMTKTKGGLKGLLLLAGKPKVDTAEPGDDEESPPSSKGGGDSTSVEDESLSRAFEAATDGDKEAFTSNMKRAFRACIDAEKEGEY